MREWLLDLEACIGCLAIGLYVLAPVFVPVACAVVALSVWVGR